MATSRTARTCFIALGQTDWAPIKPRFKPEASFSDVMRAYRREVLAHETSRSDEPDTSLFAMSYLQALCPFVQESLLNTAL